MECLSSEDNKKAKYLVDFKLKQFYLISDNGSNISKSSNIDRVFGYKIINFISSKIKASSYHADSKSSNTLIQNSLADDVSISIQSEHGGSKDWCSSSPELFPSSCQLHDKCYESGSPKGVCDDGFLLNMKTEARFLSNGDMEEYALLFAARAVYYEAVAHSDLAFVAFCLATPIIGYPECEGALAVYLYDNLEHTDDTTNGTPTGSTSDGWMGGLQTGGYGGHIIVWVCELWKFPNGEGGHYEMHRNCTYYYQPFKNTIKNCL
uniref:hypothetical protein n=1 Tax=Pseudoalteromonas mariniglutinosa TaxID=206042 RepID=UPI00387FA23B